MFCLMHVLTCLIHREEQRKSSFVFHFTVLHSVFWIVFVIIWNVMIMWCEEWSSISRERSRLENLDSSANTTEHFCLPLLFSLEELHQPECCGIWNCIFLPVPVFKVSVLKMRWHKFIFLQDAQHQGVKMCTDASYSSFCSTCWILCSVYLYVTVNVCDASFSV